MKGFTEIQLDKDTLPEDGQLVEFFISDSPAKNGESKHVGHYCESDGLILITDGGFVPIWNVYRWRATNEAIPPTPPKEENREIFRCGNCDSCSNCSNCSNRQAEEL